jgi:acetyl-CoA synthetase
MDSNKAFVHARDFLMANRTDYAAAYRGFEWPHPEQFNWALDYFDVYAKGNNRPALWLVEESGKETRLSFAEMSERSNRVANFFRGLGVRRGDRLLLMLPNVVPIWETMLACIKLGAVVIPSATQLTKEDLRDRLARGQVRHVVTTPAGAELFSGLEGNFSRVVAGGKVQGWTSFEDAYSGPADFKADGPTAATDPLILYFTSGTTAQPKMVSHTHQSYPVGHLSTMYWIGFQDGDIHFNISSPGWAKHAWSSFFAPWNGGATIFVYNYARFDAKKTLDVICRCGVTTLCAPPTVWRMLILEDLAAYSHKLRELISAGEPLNPEIIERVRAAWGITVRDGYGQTETTAQLGNSPGQPVKPGSVGRPLPGYRIKLTTADEKDTRLGEISIELKPAPLGLMAGYVDDANRSKAALGGEVYLTGDVASKDEDGYFWFIGRSDDVFKSSDYRISPFELESVLIEHKAVAEAAVVPSPDPLRLSVPKAYLLLKPGFEPTRETALDIFRFVRERLAPFKRVRRIEFTDLPKTISGKIRRVQLRSMEGERYEQHSRGPTEFREDDFPELKG